MEKILISWLSSYVGVDIEKTTTFKELNFDIFDEATVVDFVYSKFKINVNVKEEWFNTVEDLLNAISNSSSAHV
jgi:acyl carrier protein